MPAELRYQAGFGNHFETEALAGALPKGQNSPQKAPFGLYPEQLSGTSFLAPRALNRRTWLYRIRPSVVHGSFKSLKSPETQADPTPTPDQLRWDPLPYPAEKKDFIEGLVAFAMNGDPASQSGSAIHLYAANRSMGDRFFYNSDGDYLIVPQEGRLRIRTEMGTLEVVPLEICLVPRGIKFQVELPDGQARGYVCESFGAAFQLPELGPIGANGLANPRDFHSPLAAYEERIGNFELVTKFLGALWSAPIDHSPLDVVAWQGNFAPCKYDLRLFNTINTVSFDHPDPSIFTVLSSPTERAGFSNVDFVIFPPRWMVAEHTFRPPYFHRNFMSEFMGLIQGEYDAKQEGFRPGGASLHNCMSAHGPDAATFEKATNAELKPQYITNTMAFMFESRYAYRPTAWAMNASQLQKNYQDCWQGLKAHFKAK